MMMIWLLVLPLVSFFLKHFLFRELHLPPGPYIWKVLANFRVFTKRPHVAFNNLAKIYGPIVSVRVGGQLLVVASSPSTAKDILNNRNFTGRYLPSYYYGVPGLAHTSIMASKECNSKWKMLRGIGQHNLFSSKDVESNAPMRKIKVIEMVNYLRSKEGQVIDIENVTFSTVANIVTNMLVSRNMFGVDFTGEMDLKVMSYILELSEMATTIGLADIYPLLQKIDIWSKNKSTNMYQNILLIWGGIIKERRASRCGSPTSNRDFLDVLSENELSDSQIAILLMELLIVGTYTTTTVTVWLMVELMRDQEILQRVRDEVSKKAIEAGNSLNDLRLSECEHLNACIKETLRLHTPVPFGIPRRAIETCKINNYVIPKDSVVLVNLSAIHLDPENWEDPTSFKPERFLDSKNGNFERKNFEFLPFSGGQRMCPGSNVAAKGVQLMVATFVHHFDWSLVEGVDTKIEPITGLKMEKPLCLISRRKGKIWC